MTSTAMRPTSTPEEPEFCYLLSDLSGHLAMWAVRQSPYDGGPANLREVLEQFLANVRADPEAKRAMGEVVILLRGWTALEDFYKKHLQPILGYRQWNLTKYEMDQGYTDPEDPNRPVQFGWNDRHNSGPKGDYDFIDLDALTRNVTDSCFQEAKASWESHQQDMA